MNTLTITMDDIAFSSGVGTAKPKHHPLSAFLDALGSQGHSGLLPPALRWFSPDMTKFVVERPPTSVPIFYTPMMKRDAVNVDYAKKERYTIPLPWQVYLIDLADGKAEIFCRNEFLTSLDDWLYTMPFPNGQSTSGGGTFCMGNDFYRELSELRERNATLADILSFFCSYLWTIGFNDNASKVPYCVPGGLTPKPTTWTSYLKAWDKLSVSEVLKLDWKRTRKLSDFTTVTETQKHEASKAVIFRLMKEFSK